MGKPVLLAENFFNAAAFPGHVVTASGESAGAEAWRVCTGRRHRLTNRWTPETANAPAWIQVACDEAREADMLAIDRGHNLAGVTIELQVSNDNFATHTTALSVTIPAGQTGAAEPIDTGAVTADGAYLRRFPAQSGMQWRLVIPAMGARLRPELVGVYLGLSWSPGRYLHQPWAEEDDELIHQETTSDAGWVGAGAISRRRVGELRIRLEDLEAYEAARYHLGEHFGSRRPTWILYDEARAERAVLAVRPQGRQGFRFDSGWGYRQADISWVEHEPRVTR